MISPKVTGTITANFEGVTLDQVLKSVIKLADLVDKQEGSIHYIYTKGETLDEAENLKKERIITKVYKLNYVRSDELWHMVRPFLSEVGSKRAAVTTQYRYGISESATFVSGGSASGATGGAAAGGGSAGVATGSSGPVLTGFQPGTGGNSQADFDHLIIQDYESNLKIIDQIVERIDVRPVQVLIEAVIISVDWEHDRELGVNFAVVNNLANVLSTVGNGSEINSNAGFSPTKLLSASGAIASGTPADPLGFTGSTNGIKFGFVSNNVSGFVRALETLGSTKILASPRILVLNKQRAEIQLGARLGFQTLSQNFTSTIQQIQFLNTGTLLRLRPFVSDDGMVRMEIHPERSSGSVTNNIPNQQTAELTTNVMVPDGATIVIGGLMEDEDDYQLQGLPFLSRLPALGYLFGSRQKTEGRRELVVLLTPHIWSADQAMTHALPPRLSSSLLMDGAERPLSASTEESARLSASSAAIAAPSTSAAPTSDPGSMALARAATPLGHSDGLDMKGATSIPLGVSGGQDQQATSPVKRRPFQSLRRILSGRASERDSNPDSNAGVRHDSRSTEARVAAPLDPGSNGPAPLPGAAAPAGALPTPQTSVPDDHPASDPSRAAASPAGATAARTPKRDTFVAQAGLVLDRGPSRTETQVPVNLRAQPELQDRRRPPGPRPGAVSAGPRRHTVADGETFAIIAEHYYGSANYETGLWRANRGRFPRPERLTAGDLLVVPPIEELDISTSRGGWTQVDHAASRETLVRANDEEVDSPRSAASRRARTQPPPQVSRGKVRDTTGRPTRTPASPERSSEPRVHIVHRSETLRSIARDRLGDARRVEEIVELNRDRLSDDDRLTPGLLIYLPADARPQDGSR